MSGGIETCEDAMKIYVSKVPEEGIHQRARYDPSAMDMDRFDIHLTEPFEAEAFITKADRELVVKVDIQAPLHMTCARCLEAFTTTVTPDALFSYAVQPADVVDITEDVRQEIILAYPMIPVCQPACKGLCMVCGQNLNTADCGHQQQ
ncbi:MAG: DUF177 domain-containing protein [Candidatus Omnitrophica bacterium]|nr:DUF177 domain-containing protein [Candidatus Omnitrophota bacterium]